MGAKGKRGEDGLTDLERRFGVYYLEDFNATASYVKASTRKVTRRTAETNGARLLLKPAIQAFIKERRDALMGKAEITVQETMEKLAQALRMDPRKMVVTDPESPRLGVALELHELDDATAACITGIEVVSESRGKDAPPAIVRKYKFINKMDAITTAMKYHGLFEADNRQRSDPVTELVQAIQANGSRLTPRD